MKKKILSSADLRNLSSSDAKNVVNSCWKDIAASNPSKNSRKESIQKRIANSNLQSVRVFVSSTFKDFFSEREILVKQVFPELRQWCHKRGISIIDVDLRWGVPPNKSSADTIDICFEELQRCSKESEGFPFFIGLIGERYGWIPENDDISPEIREKYNWIKNVSITHMEILQGAFWQPCPNPNATFFFRNPVQGPANIKNVLPDFVDDNDFSREHLKDLKQRIRDRYPEKCIEYDAQFEGYYENDQVRLRGLEEFAEKVTAMLKSSIEYQLSQRVNLDMDAETRAHWNFVLTEQALTFVGREQELSILKQISHGASPEALGLEECLNVSPSCSSEILNNNNIIVGYSEFRQSISTVTLNNISNCTLSPRRGSVSNGTKPTQKRPMIWVNGASGSGKSSLLAKFVAEMRKDTSVELFYHFEEAAPDSNTEQCLLRRILRFMKHPFARNLNDNNAASNENFMKVASKEFGENILSELGNSLKRQKDKTFVIVIDGIDQMSDLIDWLPLAGTAPNVTAILSGNSSSRQLIHKFGKGNIRCLKLKPLSNAEQSALVEKYFDSYGKHLDPEQKRLLLRKDRAPNWLALALEELRVFGVMQKLNAKIEALPDSCSDLAWEVISRLIEEDTTEQKYIAQIFKYLACCERGIHEAGLLVVLGNSSNTVIRARPIPPLRRAPSSPGTVSFDRTEIFDGVPFHLDKPVPYIIWAQLLRTMGAFLRTHSDGRIDFSCDSYKKVVLSRLLSDEVEQNRSHEVLAIYYSKIYSSSMSFWEQFSCVGRLAYHISRTHNPRNLLMFFRKDPRANRVPPSLRIDYFKRNTCQADAADIPATICSSCMPRMAQQCILCKATLHFNKGHSCISISTNAHHSACFNPSPVKLCEQHGALSQKLCLICENRSPTIASDAYICCECSGQKSQGDNGVTEKCSYLSSRTNTPNFDSFDFQDVLEIL